MMKIYSAEHNQNSYFNYATDQSVKGLDMTIIYDCKYDKKLLKQFLIKSNLIAAPNNKDKIAKAKKTCLDLGFTAGTEKFGDCTLKVLKMKSQ